MNADRGNVRYVVQAHADRWFVWDTEFDRFCGPSEYLAAVTRTIRLEAGTEHETTPHWKTRKEAFNG